MNGKNYHDAVNEERKALVPFFRQTLVLRIKIYINNINFNRGNVKMALQDRFIIAIYI